MIRHITGSKEIIGSLSVFHSGSTYCYAHWKSCSTGSTHMFVYPFVSHSQRTIYSLTATSKQSMSYLKFLRRKEWEHAGQERLLCDRLRTQFFTGSQFLPIRVVLNGNVHTSPCIETCCPRQILRIHAETDDMGVAAVELAKSMAQESHANSLLAPRTPHRKIIDPALTIFILTEGKTSNFVAFYSQEPERRIEAFAVDRPVLPV